MPQDAFHIRRLTKELSDFLVGGKINRISQVNKDELTFIIYTGKATVKLILSANASNARVCLSLTEKEPAPIAPNFCMLLRKHLLGAEILDVRQYAFERIVEIDLHCTTDFSQSTRTLHCELMGKYSNIVLTEKGVILGALKTSALEDNSRRVLLSGAKYLYPEPQDKLSPFDGAGMRSRLENFLFTRTEGWDQETLSSFLFENVAGLALPTAREIVSRACKEAGATALVLSPSIKKPLWDFVGDFCENEPCQPCLKIQNGTPVDFFAFPVENGAKMPSLCKAEDEFYTGRETKKGFEDRKRKLENTVRGLKKKQTKKLQDTLERLKESEKADEYRIKGELLTANLYRIEKGMTSVELDNWYSEDGGKVKITLDSTMPPAKNAQRYFKTYNKHKRAREILTPMLEKEEAEIAYTDSVLTAIALSESSEDLKEIEEEMVAIGLLRAPKERVGGKRKEVVTPFREYEFDGFKIYAGRNNLQNDRLLRLAAPEDVWLHTQKYHSSHVIIVTEGRQVRDEIILFAAEICAYYSDGRDGDKIPVDYCQRKFVKKPNKSKAGFVIYTDYKTILVQPNAHKE
ncbi:MAG: fibronectin/fibrinogen-binding protein [Clostridiales bacterium]|nr:fibronectin/fibrinogen-binding protein [Clostridiales bacterium]